MWSQEVTADTFKAAKGVKVGSKQSTGSSSSRIRLLGLSIVGHQAELQDCGVAVCLL
jgi:hypothetical protein